MTAGGHETPARQARDVVAFGQEVGRALSDGRIVGRAEPFAKVFPSSRAVKRVVGAVAWAVLEDIALDARIDDAGRLVSETNVRRIAENLALNKDTVTRHLGRLRDHGFVLQEESRQLASGRWEACCYVLDPSACVERFTTTPSAGAAAQNPRSAPCPKSSDTATGPVSENTGHGVTGHGEFGHYIEHKDLGEQHSARADAGAREASGQPAGHEPVPVEGCGDGADAGTPVDADADADADADLHGDADADAALDAASTEAVAAPAEPDDVHGRLVAAGVAGHVAADLVTRHSRSRIDEALAVAAARPARNTAGWIVTALRDGWDLSGRLVELRRAQARQLETARTQRERAQRDSDLDAERRRGQGWSQAVSAALCDAQLAEAVWLVTDALPGLMRRSPAAMHAQLVAWAAAVARRFPDRCLPEALDAALAAGLDLREDVACGESLPDPPPLDAPAVDLRGRLSELLEPSPSESVSAKGASHEPHSR